MAKAKNENALLSYLTEHLAYERIMLRHTFRELHRVQDQLTWNALYESFGIHARNLYAFLRHKGTSNDVKAQDFVPSHPTPDPLLRFNDLDAFLFHVSEVRERAKKLNMNALTEFVDWIDREWKTWVDMLPEPFAPSVDRVPIRDPMVLTVAAGVPTACTVVQTATLTLPPRG